MIKGEMDKCIPDGISVTEECAQVPLHALVDYTTNRIIQLQTDVLDSVLKSLSNLGGELELLLESKYGFDESSGQSNYKQNFKNYSLDDSS